MRRKALITGGTRGIGYGIATSLASRGFDLAINGVRPEDQVRPQLDNLRDHGVDVAYFSGNIGDAGDRKKMVENVLGKMGAIHVLVNNAGVAPKVRRDILELDDEGYDYVMDINLKGTFFLTQDIARHMITQREKENSFDACIVNITSISAEVASINRGEYCMAKAGLGMVTKLFAARLGEHNIPVYEVRPGIIETDMTAGVKDKYNKLIEEGLTIEKRWGRPEDIGRIVASLVDGGLPYATGQVIYADGGMSVKRL